MDLVFESTLAELEGDVYTEFMTYFLVNNNHKLYYPISLAMTFRDDSFMVFLIPPLIFCNTKFQLASKIHRFLREFL